MVKTKLFFILPVFMFIFANDALSTDIDIAYTYSREFNNIGIAYSASAYEKGHLIAKAEIVSIIKREVGPDLIEIQETHYDSSKNTIYDGLLYVRLVPPKTHIVDAVGLSGKKKREIFKDWPFVKK